MLKRKSASPVRNVLTHFDSPGLHPRIKVAKGVKTCGWGRNGGEGVSCIRTPTDAFVFSKSEDSGRRWCWGCEVGNSLHHLAKMSVCVASDRQFGELIMTDRTNVFRKLCVLRYLKLQAIFLTDLLHKVCVCY